VKNKERRDFPSSVLARFDCDLSLDFDEPEMKKSDIFNHPDINFQFGLSEKQKAERISIK